MVEKSGDAILKFLSYLNWIDVMTYLRTFSAILALVLSTIATIGVHAIEIKPGNDAEISLLCEKSTLERLSVTTAQLATERRRCEQSEVSAMSARRVECLKNFMNTGNTAYTDATVEICVRGGGSPSDFLAQIQKRSDSLILNGPSNPDELLAILTRYYRQADAQELYGRAAQRMDPHCATLAIDDGAIDLLDLLIVRYQPAEGASTCAAVLSNAKRARDVAATRIRQLFSAVLDSNAIKTVSESSLEDAYSRSKAFSETIGGVNHLTAAMLAERLDLAKIIRTHLAVIDDRTLNQYVIFSRENGSFGDLLAMARTGDVLARKRAIKLAKSADQLEQIRSEEASMSVVDFDEALAVQDLAYGRKIRRVIQTRDGYTSHHEAQFKRLVWSRGTFEDVMGFLQNDSRGTLARAYELAKTDQERERVELEVVRALLRKLFVINFVLDGTGRTRSSDSDMIIGRKIGSEITSALRYSGRVDRAVFSPSQDYSVKGTVTLHIRGKENGERACGFLAMSKCEYKDEPYSESVNVPVTLNFTKGNSYQTSGAETIKWDAVSGGSGLASGRYMGGTRIRKADDLSMTFSLSSVEKM